MPSWYFLSLAALLLMGTQRFLYKVAAERHCSSTLTTAVFMGTVTLLSGAAFLLAGTRIRHPSTLFVLALVNSAAFALATVASMEALRRLPAAVTFPITRLSLVVVILFSLVYFHERLVTQQVVGLLLGLAAVAVLAAEAAGSQGSPQAKSRAGYFFLVLCVLGGAAATISSKFAALATSKSAFMALSYFLGTVFSLSIDRVWGRRQKNARPAAAVKMGILMGLLNFLGFYAFLTALSRGPLAIVALITGMHFVIAIALSALLFRERLTPRRLVGIGLTLLAVFLLRA